VPPISKYKIVVWSLPVPKPEVSLHTDCKGAAFWLSRPDDPDISTIESLVGICAKLIYGAAEIDHTVRYSELMAKWPTRAATFVVLRRQSGCAR
jgi:hypothetical protein